MPSRFNKYLNHQGSVLLTIILTVMVVIGVGFVYYYYTKLGNLEPPQIPLINQTPVQDDETASWKNFEIDDLSMRIPNDWYVSEDKQFISQFPFNPKKSANEDIYNAFRISKTNLQLQSGYTNEGWLDRINSLKPEERLTNEYRPATSLQVAKISSGKTGDGKTFVLFKNTALNEGAIAAFINKDTVYQFNLNYYDQVGLDTLQKIMTTVKVTVVEENP